MTATATSRVKNLSADTPVHAPEAKLENNRDNQWNWLIMIRVKISWRIRERCAPGGRIRPRRVDNNRRQERCRRLEKKQISLAIFSFLPSVSFLEIIQSGTQSNACQSVRKIHKEDLQWISVDIKDPEWISLNSRLSLTSSPPLHNMHLQVHVSHLLSDALDKSIAHLRIQ